MKKVLFIGLLLTSICVFAAKVSAPEPPAVKSEQTVQGDLKWPYGAATNSTVTADSVVTVTISNNLTLLNFGTLSKAMTLTLTPDAELEAGAMLVIKAKSDGTARNITLSGATPTAWSGTISKTKVQTFIYNGSAFIATGAIVQLD